MDPVASQRPAPTAGAAVVALVLWSTTVAGCMAGPDDGPRVQTDMVRIPGAWVFEPAHVEVTNGTVVRWTNEGGQPHTVTFEILGLDETIAPGETVELVMDRPGTHTYVCRFHPPDMTGSVLVTTNGSI